MHLLLLKCLPLSNLCRALLGTGTVFASSHVHTQFWSQNESDELLYNPFTLLTIWYREFLSGCSRKNTVLAHRIEQFSWVDE